MNPNPKNLTIHTPALPMLGFSISFKPQDNTSSFVLFSDRGALGPILENLPQE
jgi:hypothetical protein